MFFSTPSEGLQFNAVRAVAFFFVSFPALLYLFGGERLIAREC